MVHPYWPLFDLRVRTPRLELRYPSDDDLVALARLAADGVHDPTLLPFMTPWSRRPSPDLERGMLQWHWRARAEWTPASWRFEPAVVVDGEVVGTQGLDARDFATLRVCGTGSWLGQRHHGQGIGTEMRAAILHLAFVGLGAVRCESGYLDGSESSAGVSRKLGYRETGDRWHVVEGEARREVLLVLDRAEWEARRRDDIEIDGLGPCLELFGVTSEAVPTPT
jgi:RimJ/RimL family protein N-acetyltransferase